MGSLHSPNPFPIRDKIAAVLNSFKSIFFGPNGLRAGWRVILFVVSVIALQQAFVFLTVLIVIRGLKIQLTDDLEPISLGATDALLLLATIIVTLSAARLEHRQWSDYGLPGRRAFGPLFWQGAVFGFAAVSILIGLIALAHGYSPGTLNVRGSHLVYYAVLWIVANLLIGFSEEMLFRGYPQFALSRGLGFWPAATTISFLFGALHYFLKPHERWTDWACTSLLAMFVCLTLRRTGDLRFAIGFHAAFDFAAIYVYSGMNGGRFAVGRLLNATFHGSDSITGGLLGPEASLFVFPVIALLFLAFHLLYRSARNRL